jgi:hypothetical protein
MSSLDPWDQHSRRRAQETYYELRPESKGTCDFWVNSDPENDQFERIWRRNEGGAGFDV